MVRGQMSVMVTSGEMSGGGEVLHSRRRSPVGVGREIILQKLV